MKFGAASILVKVKNITAVISREGSAITIITKIKKNNGLCIEILWAHWNGSTNYTKKFKYRIKVGSKIIRTLEIIRVKKFILNAVLWNKYLSSYYVYGL